MTVVDYDEIAAGPCMIVITSILSGGPEAGRQISNSDPIPSVIVFTEKVEFGVEDKWESARNPILEAELTESYPLSRISRQVRRRHVYRLVSGNDFHYRYDGWF